MSISETRIFTQSLFGRTGAVGRRFARLAYVGQEGEKSALRPYIKGRDAAEIARRVYFGSMTGAVAVPPTSETARLCARIERLISAHSGRNYSAALDLRETLAIEYGHSSPSTSSPDFF